MQKNEVHYLRSLERPIPSFTFGSAVRTRLLRPRPRPDALFSSTCSEFCNFIALEVKAVLNEISLPKDEAHDLAEKTLTTDALSPSSSLFDDFFVNSVFLRSNSRSSWFCKKKSVDGKLNNRLYILCSFWLVRL